MKNVRRFPKILSEEDLDKVLKTIATSRGYNRKSENYLRLRDAAIVLTLYYTGLRPAECLNLRWDDIDFERKIITINPMSNKERNGLNAVLTEPAKKALQVYKEELKKIGFTIQWVFPSMWSLRPITVDAFGKRIREIFEVAGILKVEFYTDLGHKKHNYRLYSFRHTFGTKVHEKTNDVIAVSRLLRQMNPYSADKYIHMDEKGKQKIADKVFGLESPTQPSVVNNYNITNNLNVLINLQVSMNEKLDRLFDLMESKQQSSVKRRQDE